MKIYLSRANRVQRRAKRGFSLVEVILALAIFGMAIGGILGILVSSTNSTGQVLSRTTAVNLLKVATAQIEKEQQIALAAGAPFGVAQITELFPMQFSANGMVAGTSDGVLGTAYYVVDATTVSGISATGSSGSVAARVVLEIQWPLSEPNLNRRSKQELNHVFVFE